MHQLIEVKDILIYHVVNYGDTLSSIASHYGVSVGSISGMNDLGNSSNIHNKQTLRIASMPTNASSTTLFDNPVTVDNINNSSYTTITYVIEPGDTYIGIEDKLNITGLDLIQIDDQDNIYSGEELKNILNQKKKNKVFFNFKEEKCYIKKEEVGEFKKRREVLIHCYKHDGNIHRSWDEAVLLKKNDDYIVFGNNKTIVTESDGRTWRTKEPAIMYFFKDKWFNIIAQIKKDGIYYYCNIASPYIIEENTIKYIDYDLDLRIFPSGDYKILDKGEYKYHKRIMNYSDELDKFVN